MSLESNKTLGGIGAILLAIPFVSLVGIILVLIAMKGLSDHYEEESIFQNALYGLIFGIIGLIAMISVIAMFFIGYPVGIPYYEPTYTIAELTIFIVAFAVMYIFSLIAAIFYRKALTTLSKKSDEKMFETAGLLLLIGAIIPLIGEVLRFIAWILSAVGFFSIKVPTQPSTNQTPLPDSSKSNFCQYCGTPNNSDSAFCQKCGKSLK